MEHERGRRRGTGCWGRRPGEKREATTPQRKFKGLVGYIRVRLTLPSALCPAEIFFFFFFDLGVRPAESSFPDPGIKPAPLQ